MMILKEFSRIVCVSLFSYQGSLFVCLSDSSFTLSHSSVPVKYFFQVFSRHFLMSVCRSQATCLLYHILTGLSTTFFAFFKIFQIVYSEETILRDSSVRITLSNRAVNTFLKFFTKTSTCINKRYHRPFRSHGTFIDHLLIKKCKILFCRFFCCFCRSLCIISCPYRS